MKGFTIIAIAASILSIWSESARAETPVDQPVFGVAPQLIPGPEDLGVMASGGIESVRLPISWQAINPSRGKLYLEGMDAIVDDVSRSGLTTLPVVFGAPGWMSSDFRTIPHTRDQLADWTSMLAGLVRRYGSNGTFWADHPELPRLPITRWQIWNEPNLIWSSKPVSPERYARLVIESARVIKREDQSAEVMLAGLYPVPNPGRGIRADEFLDDLFGNEGFREAFDLAATHPYGDSVQASLDALWIIRSALDRNGGEGKPISITELGWGSDSVKIFGAGNQELQATRLTEAYDAILDVARELNLDSIYWFTWQDLPDVNTGCYFCFGAGLFDQYGVEKPAWDALKDVITAQQGDPAPTADGSPKRGKPRFGRISISPAGRTLRKGRGKTFRVRIRNSGTAEMPAVKVCARLRRPLKGARCATPGSIVAGSSKVARIRIAARRKSISRHATVRFVVSARGLGVRSVRIRLRLRG